MLKQVLKELWKEVAKRRPAFDRHLEVGRALREAGKPAEAADHFRKCLELDPGNPFLWLELGTTCEGLPGHRDEAIASLSKCVALKPDLAEGHYRLGYVLRRLGRSEEAERCFRKALALEPGHAEANNDLGNILQAAGRLEEATIHYRRAIEDSPDYPETYTNLGCALLRQGDVRSALPWLRRAVELQPDHAAACLNLGVACQLAGKLDEARESYRSALALRPDDTAIRGSLLLLMQQMCDWSRFEGLCQAQREAVSATEEEISPFSLLSISSSPADQLQCARNFAARYGRAVAGSRERLAFRFERAPAARLRVGYLSADFHEHATAYLTAELFELHNRSRFEIIAYSYGPDDGSPMRSRLMRAFDEFVEIRNLSHEDAAMRIYQDRVNILVDLKGYTQHARTEIVALRPAPIQVSYLGYPGTMGADFIDYLITDRFITPPEQVPFYSEKLVWMPGTYQVNDRRRAVGIAPSRAELGLPQGAFVFCCFNHTYKIVPRVFAVWMRLLEAVPGSVLWLLESNSWAVDNLRREAQRRGVDPQRIVFAPHMLSVADHLARLQAADLFLDTLPCNAHTTASDALWVGLPLLTCAGETFASRVAGSLLTTAGLPELVTDSLEQYEAVALRLARDPQELSASRRRLERNRVSDPLFDTPAFVRRLEAAYRQMWEHWAAGRHPQAIEP